MRVTICDVGPRDGLQNEPETLEPAARAEFVNRLAAAGVPRVEAASFVPAAAVAEIAAQFASTEVVLADTIGVATPSQVRGLLERTGARGVHLHNTRNTGYANAFAALEGGATLFDASCGGLGGCPYAPRATGNIATEDLVYLLAGEGIETGIDLDALITTSEWLEGVLGRRLEGQVYRAGTWARA